MAGEKLANLRKLNASELEVLEFLLRDLDFSVSQYAKTHHRSEQAVRTNLTAIYKKLLVPKNVDNAEKRGWVYKEYLDVYENQFKRGVEEVKIPPAEPEIFVNPPPPIVVNPPVSETKPPPITSKPPEPKPTQTQPQPRPVVTHRPRTVERNGDFNNPTGRQLLLTAGFVLLITFLLFRPNWFYEIFPRRTPTPVAPTHTLMVMAPTDKPVPATLTATNTIKPTSTSIATRAPTKKPTKVPTKIPSLPPTLDILFEDQFNGDEISPQWVPGNSMYMYPYYTMSDGVISLNKNNLFLYYYVDPDIGKNWRNYVIEAKIIINKCVKNKNESFNHSWITARDQGDNWSALVFKWSPCDYQPNTELNVEISIQNDNYTTSVNGEIQAYKKYDQFLDKLKTGGIGMYLTAGSSIDYTVVRELP